MATLFDLSAWTIESLTQAYVGLLMRDEPLGPVERAEMTILQAEWGRRPAGDRVAALQRYRGRQRPPYRALPAPMRPPVT